MPQGSPSYGSPSAMSNLLHKSLLVFLCLIGSAVPGVADKRALSLQVSPGNRSLRILSVNGEGNEVRFVREKEAFYFAVASHVIRYEGPSLSVGKEEEIAGNGRLKVIAPPDGTLRWKLKQREVLALLPLSDGKRCVLFTPSGYYEECGDAGMDKADKLVRWESAARLIGWRSERSDGGADFFPLSLFRRYFHRPEVVKQALYAANEQDAVRHANQRDQMPPPPKLSRLWPPVVEILDPPSGATIKDRLVKLHVRLRSPSGGKIEKLSVKVNGGEAPVGVLAGGGTQILSIQVPVGDCTVSVVASTALMEGEPRELKLRWGGGLAPEERHMLRVLSVGVGAYPSNALAYAAKDAKDVVSAFLTQEGKNYQKVESTLLRDNEATKARIIEELTKLGQRSYQLGDTVVIFLAGHGSSDGTGRYTYLPYDAALGERIDGDQIQTLLARIQARVLLFLDTCHSGDVAGEAMTRLLSDLIQSQRSLVVFTASTGLQIAKEDPKWKNGAFTKAVVEGLAGQADLHARGLVTVSDLSGYVSKRVQQMTLGQTPATAIPRAVPDFTLARVKVPLHRRRWFWGVMASVVVTAGVGVGIGMGLRPPPSETITFTSFGNHELQVR